MSTVGWLLGALFAFVVVLLLLYYRADALADFWGRDR